MTAIKLFEDNAGGLYINIEGSEAVWRHNGPHNITKFEDDAQGLIEGDEWQGVDTAPLSDIEDLSPVAIYDGELDVCETPGRAAQMYLYGKYLED